MLRLEICLSFIHRPKEFQNAEEENRNATSIDDMMPPSESSEEEEEEEEEAVTMNPSDETIAE